MAFAIFTPAEILSLNSNILPIAMKVGSKDARPGLASFALLFVKNYAILELSDKISVGGWWIPKCYFFRSQIGQCSGNNFWYTHITRYARNTILNELYVSILFFYVHLYLYLFTYLHVVRVLVFMLFTTLHIANLLWIGITQCAILDTSH